MYFQRLTKGDYARALALIGAMLVSGCGGGFGLSSASPPRPTLNLSTLGIGDDSTYFETGFENNLFEESGFVELNGEPRVIRGKISGDDDVDVYDLGPVSRGMRIVVEITAAESLNGALALFDDTGASLLVNDHRNAYLGRKDPFVNVVIRRDSDACYVAVSATPGYNALGTYAMLASKESPVPIPSVRPDTVLLIFNGGTNVQIGQRRPLTISSFDPVDIDERFGGDASSMIREIVSRVREDYAGLNVTILSTSEGSRYDGSMTRIFFGAYDAALLGVADGVDEFNSTQAQEAIIFTDTFAAFSRLEPSVLQMSRAIANVTSHEIGHLLGLVHTKDSKGIMDVTASLNQLLVDQDFRMSPLYTDVFPIGWQNALQLLVDAVGGDVDPTAVKGFGDAGPSPKSFDDAGGPSARESLLLSTCGLGDHAG